MIAYEIIEIADRLNIITKNILEKFLDCDFISSVLKNDARNLIKHAETLSLQVDDNPNLETLHIAISSLNARIAMFIEKISVS